MNFYPDPMQDKPPIRKRLDIYKEMRHSKRTPEQIKLCLAAIKNLYSYIDSLDEFGVYTAKEVLSRDCFYS